MKCLECNNPHFVEKKLRFSPDVKGESIDVITECFVCTKCGSSTMNDDQMDALRKKSADLYRKKHALLTSQEIIKFRTELGMSQADFAEYLNVGIASIKRWETYYVQDASQDEHIRLKCDKLFAELNTLQLHYKHLPPDSFNGNRKFSFELIKNVILYLLPVAKSPLYLNKVLFYADFLHFKKYNHSLTGAAYVALEYGPCPDQFQTIFSYLEGKNYIKRTGKHNLEALEKPNLKLIDDQELETLQYIYTLAKTDGGKKLYELSHREIAFKKTAFAHLISYAHARALLVS